MRTALRPRPGRGGGGPRRVDPAYIEGIFKDVSGLGYYGLELFSFQIQGMEANGGMASLIEKYNLPLISAYGGPNLMDAAQRKENIAQAIEWAKLLKKYGGKVSSLGPTACGATPTISKSTRTTSSPRSTNSARR